MIKLKMIFAFLFITAICFGQNIKNVKVGYGVSIFAPSTGLGHNVFLESDFINTRFGELRTEVSFQFGGPYWYAQTPGEQIENSFTIDPYKTRLFNFGLNLRRNLSSKGSGKFYYSIGAFGAYGSIVKADVTNMDLPVEVDPNTGRIRVGIQTSFTFVGDNIFRPVVPIKFGLENSIGKINYEIGIFDYIYSRKYHNVGIGILVGLSK